MISTSATVFTQHPERSVPRLAQRFLNRFESIRLGDGTFVLHVRSVGTVVMTEFDNAVQLQYVVQDAPSDFAARESLQNILRRELRGVVHTIGWDEPRTVPVPLR